MAAAERNKDQQNLPVVEDEPGMAERFQRGLQRAFNTPPKHRPAPTPKAKGRPASKGRVHKGNARN